MSKLKYTEFEKQMNSVLKHQDKALADIHFPSLDKTDATIARTEDLLRNLGYQPEALKGLTPIQQPKRSWLFLLGKNCVPRQRDTLV